MTPPRFLAHQFWLAGLLWFSVFHLFGQPSFNPPTFTQPPSTQFSQPFSQSGTHSDTQQTVQNSDSRTFFLDVLCFKGSADSAQRVDVYSVIPYSALTFTKRGAQYVAAYTLVITLKSKEGATLQEITKEYPLADEKAEAASGVTGAIAYAQNSLNAAPGAYLVEAKVVDMLGKRSMAKTRSFTTIDFNKYDLSLSSLMLSSAIIQSGGRYAVTPYLDDDIAPLVGDAFYAFFESYFQSLTVDSVDVLWEILDARTSKRTTLGKRVRRFVKAERVQQYVRIDIPPSFPVGNYTLRVLALRPDAAKADLNDYEQRDVLAATQRSVRIEWKGLGYGTALQGEDLERAIRQLRFATTQNEVAAMMAASNEEEKQKRFYEFWKRLDPTPSTPRNEAYEEYYARIEFANRTFRYRPEGWQTDMGMVYVIYGQPSNANEQRRIDGRTLVSWYYAAFGREFVFIDSGFNDFRLISPPPVERYRYRR
jgi:GWxTD domain-containing protein